MTSMKVVFPDPLGPMSPTMEPRSTSMDRLFTATTPPKLRVTCRDSRIVSILERGQFNYSCG